MLKKYEDALDVYQRHYTNIMIGLIIEGICETDAVDMAHDVYIEDSSKWDEDFDVFTATVAEDMYELFVNTDYANPQEDDYNFIMLNIEEVLEKYKG